MNRKQYEIDNLPTQIVIGHQTETGVTSIYFDCTSWLASWPDLVLGVWATQPGGTAAYPATTHMEGDVLVWDVTDSDTAVPGVGTVEIVGITTGKKKLSAIAKTQIMRTTTGTTTTPPEGAKAWVDNVMQAASDAETSKTQAATYAEDAEASAKKAEENAKSVTWETLAGKPSAFPPETHGHAMSEVDGLPDALSQLKDDLVSYRTAVNLLDNSDFTRFVAQAGIGGAHGTQAYAGDRWILISGTVAGSKKANGDGYSGIVLNGTIRQIIPDAPDTATPSIGMISGAAQITYADGAVEITSEGGSLAWAALYEGSYTADTLPPYVPKGYTAELAECQRYYVHIIDGAGVYGYSGGSGIIYVLVQLPQIMRLENVSIVKGTTVSIIINGSTATVGNITEKVIRGKQLELQYAANDSIGGLKQFTGWISTLCVSADL